MSAADQSSLSPIAACLRIAAQRGRALRLAREQAQRQADEPPANVGRALAFIVNLAAEPARRDDDRTQRDQSEPTTERAQ